LVRRAKGRVLPKTSKIHSEAVYRAFALFFCSALFPACQGNVRDTIYRTPCTIHAFDLTSKQLLSCPSKRGAASCCGQMPLADLVLLLFPPAELFVGPFAGLRVASPQSVQEHLRAFEVLLWFFVSELEGVKSAKEVSNPSQLAFYYGSTSPILCCQRSAAFQVVLSAMRHQDESRIPQFCIQMDRRVAKGRKDQGARQA
jgi:hypothetical protein